MTAQPPNASPKIFISYAWENQPTAKQLQQALQAASAEVFVDYTGIQGGDSLPIRISQGLDWCDTLILLWSQHAKESYWVELEWTSAIALKRHLIPCKLDETPLPEILMGKRYLEFKNFDHGLHELLAALSLKKTAPLVPESTIRLGSQFPLPRLRSQAQSDLLGEDVAAMLKHYDFFCAEYDWNKAWCNPQGKGIKHDYEVQHDGKVVIDHATGLSWQQSGSQDFLSFAGAEKYIRDLNNQRFAGYSDWRLPTLEEAMSLMEAQKHADLYIDPIFDRTQKRIWMVDKPSVSAAWVVYVFKGYCVHSVVGTRYCVRAVRVGQSTI